MFAIVGGLAMGAMPTFSQKGNTSEIYHRGGATILEMTDALLPTLGAAKSPAFFANLPIGDVAKWTFIERFPGRPVVECFVRRFGTQPEANETRLAEWFQKTQADVLVYVEVDHQSPLYFPAFSHFEQYGDFLRHRQNRFYPAEVREFPSLGCKATIWRPQAHLAATENGNGIRR
jgi:hypothetical protein